MRKLHTLSKPEYQRIFDSGSNEAYVELGVLRANLMWQAFDCRIEAARRGEAKKFAMALWHHGIIRDTDTNTLWYAVPYVWGGQTSRNRDLLVESLHIAAGQGITMTGILKDESRKPHRCSSTYHFNIDAIDAEFDAECIWLSLSPTVFNDLNIPIWTADLAVAKKHFKPKTLQELREKFENAVEASAKNRDARLQRLEAAPSNPFIEKIEVTTYEFKRNPDVVAEALYLAQGVCHYCRNPAPFARRTNGTPYLEVHHKTPLSQGGTDTVDNAVATCPNCHREQHHGASVAI